MRIEISVKGIDDAEIVARIDAAIRTSLGASAGQARGASRLRLLAPPDTGISAYMDRPDGMCFRSPSRPGCFPT